MSDLANKVQEFPELVIEITRGPHAGKSVHLKQEKVTIGRGIENDIVLMNDPRVSRQHLEFSWNGSDLIVTNTSGKNYVFVDGEKIEFKKLLPQSRLVCGDSEIIITWQTTVFEKQKVELQVIPKIIPSVITQKNNLSDVLPPQQKGLSQAGAQLPSNLKQRRNVNSPIPPSAPQMPQQFAMADRQSELNQISSLSQIMSNPRSRFYLIIGVVALAALYLFVSDNAKKKVKDRNEIRSNTKIELDMKISEEETKKYLERMQKYETADAKSMYRRAQENFVKGFRDYQQGQYGRARDSFQVVLNLDAENELARRYYYLAKVKFDEQVKFHMLQGNRYREKKNWRMCMSSYFSVMIMLQTTPEDPLSQEAKRYYMQCQAAQKGRF